MIKNKTFVKFAFISSWFWECRNEISTFRYRFNVAHYFRVFCHVCFDVFRYCCVDFFCYCCLRVFDYAFFYFCVFWRIDRELNVRKSESWCFDSLLNDFNFFFRWFHECVCCRFDFDSNYNFCDWFFITFVSESIIEIDFENLNDIFAKKQKRRQNLKLKMMNHEQRRVIDDFSFFVSKSTRDSCFFRIVLFMLFFELSEIVESLWKQRSKKRLSLNSLLKRTKTSSWMKMMKNCLIVLNVVACSCRVVILLTLRVFVVRDKSKRVYRYVFDSLFKNFFLIILNFNSIQRNCVRIDER
jgi:hypothetical protein